MTDAPGEAAGIRVRASRANAVILLALGLALVAMMALRAGPGRVGVAELVGFAPFVTALAVILLVCGSGLALRRSPVFEASMAGVAMPVGLMGLVHLPWDAVVAWGISERRIPWLPILRQRVFAIWLRERDVLPRMRQSEISLNRAMMGADLVLSDWFVPRGFDAIVLTCRAIRPDLERRA